MQMFAFSIYSVISFLHIPYAIYKSITSFRWLNTSNPSCVGMLCDYSKFQIILMARTAMQLRALLSTSLFCDATHSGGSESEMFKCFVGVPVNNSECM